ncbi:GntR family transcriptional regulator [Actinoplanes oblitus]|uniref:GntR family transcriptional regulator n=1 Tax=Actinoplanes oblitus TaxID=3040509 RepID=A0ABY8WRX2_9ACTN|nr:GntR family transcriptional regulator [Actinoplanes oblitus]WIM98550.1 GntR family transcriptional regulator [Actinoplanes oblitus]
MRPQLSDEVAAALRGRIMSGELRPGARVRLEEVAAQLGVSITPVREALLRLAADRRTSEIEQLEYAFPRTVNRMAQARKLSWFPHVATRYTPARCYAADPGWPRWCRRSTAGPARSSGTSAARRSVSEGLAGAQLPYSSTIWAAGPAFQYTVMTEACDGPVSRATTSVLLRRVTVST